MIENNTFSVIITINEIVEATYVSKILITGRTWFSLIYIFQTH